MAIKKLVKLSHSDSQINQVQRNVEDVLTSINLHLQTGSLLSAITASLDARYPSQASVSQNSGAYVLLSASQQQITGAISVTWLGINGDDEGRRFYFHDYLYSNPTFETDQGPIQLVISETSGNQPATLQFFSAGSQKYTLGKNYDQTFYLQDNVNGNTVFTYQNLGSSGSFQFAYPLPVTASGYMCTNFFQCGGNALFYAPVAIANSLGVGGFLQVGGGGNMVGTFSLTGNLGVVGDVRATGGYRCQAGTNGTTGSNVQNIFWTGTQAQLWINSTNIGNISTTSDKRLKHNIVTMSGSALTTLAQLRPVSFNWMTMGPYVDDGVTHFGFIADEVQQVIPSAVAGMPMATASNGSASFQTLVPSEMTPYFVKGIQELSAAYAYQASQLVSQSTQIGNLAAQVTSQSFQVANLQQASSSFANQITTLQTQQSASQGQIVSLQVSLAALSGTVAILQKLLKPI